ncbi:MAG TPA: hypothetical protein VK540_15455 [Polyangiaceae bacterium]|nr:hypothetical protein [Polyangiaceae bacterium]
MHHARFLAAVLSLNASGAMLLGGPLLTGEGQAIAAARRTVKAPSARAARARRSSDSASAVRRTSDAARDGAAATTAPDARGSGKDASRRERDTVPEKNAATRGVEKPGAKNPPESASSTKSTAEAVKPTPENGASRNAEARPSAAKPPSEAIANQRVLAERLANESAAGDGSDASRAAVDPAAVPTFRRDLAPSSTAASIARPVAVTLEGPVFDGGDVPRAGAALDRMKSAFVRCASIESALAKNEASIDLRFLVRSPGRAEGVDVDKARGVSADVVRCMTSVLARSYIGAPSDDPVGVAVTVRLRKD